LRGRLSTGIEAYKQALDLYRQMGDARGMARILARLGRALLDCSRLAESKDVLYEGLRLATEHREPLSIAYAAGGLATLAHLTGDDQEAERRYEQAIAIRHELGDLLAEAYTRLRLGMHYVRAGRFDDADREFRQARTLRHAHGAKSESSLLLRGMAELALARGDVLSASDLAEQAVAAVGEADMIARATHNATLARVRAVQGRGEEADALFQRSLQVLEEREYPIDLALTLLKYGEALLQLGQAQRAQPLLERARGLFAGMGATRFVNEVDARLAVVA
jgi:tetratricopeptide (TPR) repeat protein